MTPILNKAAEKVLKDVLELPARTGDTIEVEYFAKEYAMSAIMASGFSIGEFN